ncbi:DUF1697 domain-containing protein [Paenibacillaceae bacterium WGS1546]|uniref:DUF1697 domain-containing protein n=1 Tax=Cohnella sp. WGS1546 TaxID=3366810 RepID=UPI00372D7316
MTVYIAWLRGINVAGQRKVEMKRLKTVFEQADLLRVRTYIQSGNVVFEAAAEEEERLASRIERAIEEEFGFPVPVVLRTADELEEVIRRNPFKEAVDSEAISVYVSFLKEKPSKEAAASCMEIGNDVDELIIGDREAYVLIRKNDGKSLFSNNFLEKKLKVAATTRNWATVNKLAAIGRE